MPPPDDKLLLRMLHTAIEHLSWPASRQKDYLTELGVAPQTDELALEFDAAFQPARNTSIVLHLSRTARESLSAIDHALNDASGVESEVWFVDSLAQSAMWTTVRRHASYVLGELEKRPQ